MRRHFASSVILTLVAVLLFSSAGPPLVSPWYAEGHRIVAWQAVKLLPTEWREFFTYYGYVVNASANYPDQSWQDFDPNEGPNHYIDLEIAGPNLENKEAGVLPYAINETYHKLVEYWRTGNIGMALIYAGALSHYVGDSGQPYHTTVNYNPKGKHGLADSLLEAHLNELNLVRSTQLAPVGNVFDEAVRIIWESHGYLTVLNATLIGDPDNPNDDKDWSNELRDMVEERGNRVIVFTARLWMSAIQEAGVIPPQLPRMNNLTLTVSAPSEVFDNKSAIVMIHVVDSLGVPVRASVSAKFGNTDLFIGDARDKNPIGKYQALIPAAVLAENSGKQVELSVSASFLDRSPASWKGSILVKASKPQAGVDATILTAASVVVVVMVVAVLFTVRRRKER